MVFKTKLKLRVFSILVVSAFCFLSSCTTAKQDNMAKDIDLINYVDPYIGSGGHGHVFVGASVPFGGIQVGPSNINKGWDWTSAYHYTDSIIKGFGHLHLSGTGISDLSDVLIMPANGELKINVGTQDNPDSGYASYYSHDNEKVEPGYYSLLLDSYGINIEMTCTERVAFHKIKYPKSDSSRLIIDLHEGNCETATETFFEKINDTVFVGYRFSTGWAKDQREYFAMILSKPVSNVLVYNGDTAIVGTQAKGKSVKAFLEFSTSDSEIINVKVGISPVSSDNALLNIKDEIPHWDFNQVLEANQKLWNKELSKIQIKTDDESKKRIFYTSLYHTMIAPNLFNDSNGEFRATTGETLKDTNLNYYTLFSLWDTYRTAHPLYTITQSERLPDIINSMLSIYKQQGKLPIWHLRGNETNTMVGYSAIPVICDAILKGTKNIDTLLAYEAVYQSATKDFEAGIKELDKFGYIPGDLMYETVARALEYAISDWAISKLALHMGKTADAEYFAKRAKGYEQYFDKTDNFMKGKMVDGSWRTPFNPISAEHRVNDYCEGNAWQYIWLVPQDPEGLIALFGGDDSFVNKLDSLFIISSDLEEGASSDITGLIGQYAHGNEPSHHITYLYAYAGQPYKTAPKVRYILNELYLDDPNGICGNEDCGQMSAWYIMSSMGFYPVNPSNGAYVFGSPLFSEVTINLPDAKEFKIIAENNSDSAIYIQSVTLNGENYTKSFITHKQVMSGGELIFKMGTKPNLDFGALDIDRPKSLMY